ncbi:MAG: hypothetical protein M3Q86_11345 [Verrucomicrobiota bacterium]|nr:hypothetical protein [Verrucomicrobiota bacterium]
MENAQETPMKNIVLALLICIIQATPAFADTFVVNNPVDPGNGICDAVGCTLREAIDAANANPGADIINFSIFGAGVKTITPTSALPTITEAVTIDGYTQPGAAENTLATGNDAVLLVELNGTLAGFGSSGLGIDSSDSRIRGLVINRFLTAGITLSGAGADDNIIEGNFIGTNAGGTTDLGNAESGIAVNGASNNLIGGSQPSARNLIAGNGTAGVLIFSTVVGVTASANIVEGNYIGTDATGTAALGNAEDGVQSQSTPPIISSVAPQRAPAISFRGTCEMGFTSPIWAARVLVEVTGSKAI